MKTPLQQPTVPTRSVPCPLPWLGAPATDHAETLLTLRWTKHALHSEPLHCCPSASCSQISPHALPAGLESNLPNSVRPSDSHPIYLLLGLFPPLKIGLCKSRGVHLLIVTPYPLHQIVALKLERAPAVPEGLPRLLGPSSKLGWAQKFLRAVDAAGRVRTPSRRPLTVCVLSV